MQTEERFSLEEMMHTGHAQYDNGIQKTGINLFVALTLVVSFVVAFVFVFMVLSGDAKNSSKEKHTRMESLATSISTDQNWEETRSESPSENSKGWLIREWKPGNSANLDGIASKLGITMEDVPYPAGCREGMSGELLIQLCAKPDNRTISLVIA